MLRKSQRPPFLTSKIRIQRNKAANPKGRDAVKHFSKAQMPISSRNLPPVSQRGWVPSPWMEPQPPPGPKVSVTVPGPRARGSKEGRGCASSPGTSVAGGLANPYSSQVILTLPPFPISTLGQDYNEAKSHTGHSRSPLDSHLHKEECKPISGKNIS